MKIKKIAVEEHIASPETLDGVKHFHPHDWDQVRSSLLGMHDRLLQDMDANGVEMAIVSLNSPAVQAQPVKQEAIEAARRYNDFLAEQVAKNTSRFRGFAALPMQSPEAAAAELMRCVKQLGFKGAMVNGYSQLDSPDSAVYYDLPQYWPFWATVESLGVPFYLHPRDVLPSRRQAYAGHPWLLGAAWTYALETATHALRLMGSGLFDAHPKLCIILGHLGEMLPNAMWRVNHSIGRLPGGYSAKRPMAEYFCNNFYVTTSGNFCTQTLMNAILWLGSDRILFAADYPFEQMREAAEWFDSAPISETDRLKIGRQNAEALFRLKPAEAQKSASA